MLGRINICAKKYSGEASGRKRSETALGVARSRNRQNQQRTEKPEGREEARTARWELGKGARARQVPHTPGWRALWPSLAVMTTSPREGAKRCSEAPTYTEQRLLSQVCLSPFPEPESFIRKTGVLCSQLRRPKARDCGAPTPPLVKALWPTASRWCDCMNHHGTRREPEKF